MTVDRSAQHQGFTVLELMIALAIIGILAAMAIPTFNKLQLKAKTGEVKLNLSAIRTAENLYHTEHGRFIDAAVTPAAWTPRSVTSPFTGGGIVAFDALGFMPEGQVYFQYAVRVSSSFPYAYTADALADIDGDGTAQIWGYVHPDPSGNVVAPGQMGCVGVIVGTATGVRDVVGPCGEAFGQHVF